MLVGRRGASRVASDRVSKEASLPELPPLPPLMAIRAGEPEGAASSMIEFHSPQEAHLPDQRVVTAPQAWQTKAREILAIRELAADIAPEGAGAEIGQHFVVDGAGMSREELLNGNADIVRAKVKDAAKASPNSVVCCCHGRPSRTMRFPTCNSWRR